MNLKTNKLNPINKKSSIYHLNPYIDEKGVLRSRGRIDAAKVSYDVKRPIILPKNNDITNLIVKFYHAKYVHQNFETVINEIRQKYVIPQLRAVLKNVIKNCQICKNRKAKPAPPLMGPLPQARLMYTQPFTYMGIDFFGPMLITVGRSNVKRWGILATCLTTRAVHIEICSSLSTDVCIMVLRTIFARRGTPSQIYSDHGTNFKGASEELKKPLKSSIMINYPKNLIHQLPNGYLYLQHHLIWEVHGSDWSGQLKQLWKKY